MLELELRSSGNDPQLEEARQSYTTGRLKDARRKLLQHLSRNREDGRGWELLGLVHHARQKWALSLAALEEASTLVPLSCVGELALADCYFANGQTKWALALYRGIPESDRATTQTLLTVAAKLDSMSDPVGSIAACRKAIQLDPDSAESYFTLSFYLRRCGAPFSVVEAAARRAIDLAPDKFAFRLGLAGQLHAQGRLADVARLLNRVTLEQVQSLSCPCCLDRLIVIFAAIADEDRVLWCREHLGTVGQDQG